MFRKLMRSFLLDLEKVCLFDTARKAASKVLLLTVVPAQKGCALSGTLSFDELSCSSL